MNDEPQEPKKEEGDLPPPVEDIEARARWADGEMARIMNEAWLRQYAPYLTVDDLRAGLKDAEARQLWLKRREEARQAPVADPDKGGRPPPKLPRGAEKEILRRIDRGEAKIAANVATKFPKADMKLRTWQRAVQYLRRTKATKPVT